MRTVTLSDAERQQVVDVLYSELSRIDDSDPLTRLDHLRRRKVRRQIVRLIVKFEGPEHEQDCREVSEQEVSNEGTLSEDRQG